MHKLSILSWNLDIDQTIIKMSYFLKNLKETITGFTETKKILRQERRLDDFNENTFSELLTVSNFSLKKLSIQFGEDLYFKSGGVGLMTDNS